MEAEPAPIPIEQRQGWESLFGLTWISRIGAVTLVLGVAFFFKYAFDNRWITESGRVLLGIGGGALAAILGERFWRTGQHIYGQALTAAAIAFFYLSFWAAFGLYQLIGRPPALGLMALTTAAAGALALRYASMAIAALALAGGYATPLLLGGDRDMWIVLGYALLLNIGSAWMARSRNWPALEVLSLAGTVVLYAAQWQWPLSGHGRTGLTLLTIALYFTFTAGRMVAVVIAAQIFAAAALANIWTPALAVFLPLLLVTGCGLAIAWRRGLAMAAAGAFAAYWLAYALWAPAVEGIRPLSGEIACLTAAFLLFLAWPLLRAPLRVTELVMMALNAAFYFTAVYELLQPDYAHYGGLFALMVAAPHMAVGRLLWQRDRRASLFAAGAAWLLLVLAAPLQFTAYRVTMAWSLEAAALAWIGSRLSDRRTVLASQIVFALVLARLVFLDSWMFATAGYPLLLNARFLTFLISAAAMWAAAYWVRTGVPALSIYVSGHFAAAWGLSLEIMGWAARFAAPENVRSVQGTAISILLAAYAVLLVASGVVKHSAVNRILGIGLIGFVVLKLYLYDVWFLGLFYRMAAFAVLGALLLGTSYLYSRYRNSIENWWRS
jgi:hypothetical protein